MTLMEINHVATPRLHLLSKANNLNKHYLTEDVRTKFIFSIQNEMLTFSQMRRIDEIVLTIILKRALVMNFNFFVPPSSTISSRFNKKGRSL